MEKIKVTSLLGGCPPIFTDRDMDILKKKAEAAKVKHIPNKVMGTIEGAYDIRAYDFAHAYRRGAEPWEMMSRKQRDWLWQIKDSLR